MWTIEPTDEYIRARKWYAKKRPRETSAVHDNLEAYIKSLNLGTNPLNAKFGFLHDERRGVFAVDQRTNNSPSDAKKLKLSQTRLYFYPEVETGNIYLLTIGDKNSQQDDVRRCHEFVEDRRKELQDEGNRQKVREPERPSTPDGL